MDAKNIIQRGERAKYIVKSNRTDFDFGTNDFYLEIIYGSRCNTITIEKSDFQHLDDYWVFSFSTSDMAGKILARMVMQVGERQEVDEQYIGIVIDTPCPQFFRYPKCDGVHDVIYTRTEESDIAEKYAILCDCHGVPILTSDDEYICVLREIIKE